MSGPETSVAEFYRSVMSCHAFEIQHLVVRLLSSDFNDGGELADEIMAVAEQSTTQDESE